MQKSKRATRTAPPTTPEEAPAEYPAETIAELLLLSPAQVYKLADEGTLPKNDRGAYPVIGCVQAYIRHLRETGGRGGRKTDTGVAAAVAREKNAKADITEIKRDEMLNHLVPADAVKAVWEGIVLEVRQVIERCRGMTEAEKGQVRNALRDVPLDAYFTSLEDPDQDAPEDGEGNP